MSDLYGIGNAISMGNMADQEIIDRNRQIRELNISNKKAYGDKVKSITDNFKGQISATKGDQKDTEEETGATGVAGALKTAKEGQAFLLKRKAVLQQANDMLEGRGIRTLTPVDPVESGATADINAVEDFGRSLADGRAFVPARIGTAGNPVLASEVGSDIADIGKTTTLAGKGIDLLGKAGAGLGVVSGVLDAGKDIESAIKGKGLIAGDNSLQKASNISGMISGGLEATGLALDTTGVLAPVGLALNVAGGVAGAVSGALDYFGDKKDEKTEATKEKQAVQSVKKPTPMPQARIDTAQTNVPTATVGRQNVVRSY